MKKLMIFATAVAMLFAAGCATEYDDTPLWNEIDSINDRIDDLEDLCRELNNDIESVQKLVDSLENNDYVTAVTPIVKNGETIGYTISFTKSDPITIYHGEDGTDGEDGRDGEDGEDGRDGRDGNIPNIGVKKHTDGRYYWTINGDWLLDNNGNKVPATGEDGKDGVDGEDGTNGKDGIDGEDGNNGANGKDGITPVLKIENDYWYVSYDNGLTWTRLDKSIDDSCNGGSSIFKSVTQDKDNVYFTLTDGTVITVPLATSNALYRLQSISYVPAYSDGKALVEFNTPSDSRVVMDFELAPMDVATEIANNWEELLSMKAVGVETRASTLIDMEVIACEADDQGIITVTASCENLSDDFFAGYQYMNARLEIADESFNHKSEYVPMITINHESTDKPIIPVTPTIKNNQIIYTTVDGNSIQPSKYANFGANIVSNEYINGKGIITFDKDITIIPNDAFINNLTLLSVILPNQVETIGSSAFSGCKYLEQVTIGKYTLSIGGNAFYGCIRLNSINFPSELKYINGNAFNNCDALTEITLPNSLKTIGYSAFSNCDKLAKVDLGQGVTEMGNYAFSACPSIKEIVIPNSVTSIGEYAFDKCTNLATVTVGDSTITIGASAFNGCSELTTVVLGKKVETIGGNAFYGCIRLSSINFPAELKYINGNAFNNCDALTEITLPNSVKTIGYSAFSDCDKLAKVDLGQGVTEIGNYAFSECGKLVNIYCRPTTPPTIGYYTFNNIGDDYKIYVPAESLDTYTNKWTTHEYHIFKGTF